jgi:hypothetical protein
LVSTNKRKKTLDIVITFLCDTFYGAVLFVGVFAIAFGLTEFLNIVKSSFDDTAPVLWAAKFIKYLMLFVDTGLMMSFIARQGWYGICEMWSDD